MKYGLWLPASIMLIAIMSLSLVFSSTNFVTIGNLGQISINEITAASGSAADIQAAVNQVAACTGRGKVHIPPGNFNWVNVGESWRTVSVPAGIDVIGGVVSGTDSYGLGVPTTWSTVIQVPQSFNTGWNKLNFFDIGDGSQDPTKPVRIANLKFVGYRTFNPSSKDMYIAIMVYGVINYRVDHCCFENLAGGVLGIFPYYNQNMYCCGVFDHNWAYNTHGWADLGSYVAGNIDNAIELHRSYYALDGTTTSPFPFDPTMNVLGQYTKYTCFIENNIFSRWYHSVSSGHGAHYVFRYNVDDQSDGTMQIDLHGVRDDRPSGAGGRCMEV